MDKKDEEKRLKLIAGAILPYKISKIEGENIKLEPTSLISEEEKWLFNRYKEMVQEQQERISKGIKSNFIYGFWCRDCGRVPDDFRECFKRKHTILEAIVGGETVFEAKNSKEESKKEVWICPEKELKLKVGELTESEDFGRGIVRLDINSMKNIGVKEGDVIEIERKRRIFKDRKTGVIAIRNYSHETELNIIRMDNLVRKNCDASIGEYIKVRKIDVKEAKHVTLSPVQKGLTLHISPNLLKQNLFMRPVRKGDIIINNPVFKLKNQNNIDTTKIKLLVVNTIPNEITRINDNTEIELKP